MTLNFKQLLRKACNAAGLDIVRMSKSPRHTILGLRHLPVRTVIDVGANTGQFAQRISKLFTKAHIYSFEPLPEPYQELKTWSDRQNGRVTAFNLALGDMEGTGEMMEHLDHTPSSSFLKSTDTCEKFYPFTKRQSPVSVKISTLDQIFSNSSYPLIHDILIKLDVQGYEDKVIRGGKQTFRKADACIVEICFEKLYQNQATFKDLVLLLDGLGYHYAGNFDQIYADDGHIIYIDAVFTKS